MLFHKKIISFIFIFLPFVVNANEKVGYGEYIIGTVYKTDIPIKINIEEKKFDKELFKLEYCSKDSLKKYFGSDHEIKMVCTMNNQVPFGLGTTINNDDIAYSFVSKLVLLVDDKTYHLDSSGMFDAIFPANFYSKKYKDKPLIPNKINIIAKCLDKYNCGIRGIFSDGCCGYSVEWIIVDGVTYRSMIFQNIKSVLSRDSLTNDFLNTIELNIFKKGN